EFARFQRKLVTDFLAWQAAIVGEYKQAGQFVTQNFDFEWRGYSYGVQPDVDHFAAAETFDIAGVDIYHPSQDELTGTEISFGGDMARSLKGSNYLVMETQAQAFAHWVPYPGQLRLQAFSHLASGANMVAYWHWHSIHNSFETYWKGLLSHDFQPNPVYNEAGTIGRDFGRLSTHLINLKKSNRAAILVSNESLTALEWFKLPGGFKYNDIVRRLYDGLYRMNIECDFVHPGSSNLAEYSLLIVPALYTAPSELLEKLNAFVREGGHIVYTFKSGFADEDVKVRTTAQPGMIGEACGISYSMFAEPRKVGLRDDPYQVGEEDNVIEAWMELITPHSAEVLAYYDHPHWGEYAAITRNHYGKGSATYIGCLPSPALTAKLLEQAVREAGLWSVEQQLAFPLIIKSGMNELGRRIRYIFNYSDQPASFNSPFADAQELLSGKPVESGQELTLDRWGFAILEERS
ncbi:beta-galactosidase, partial [Paenibacillus sepulcri]|nr:beta-galactosidase [Paenibacillus sepulcri]